MSDEYNNYRVEYFPGGEIMIHGKSWGINITEDPELIVWELARRDNEIKRLKSELLEYRPDEQDNLNEKNWHDFWRKNRTKGMSPVRLPAILKTRYKLETDDLSIANVIMLLTTGDILECRNIGVKHAIAYLDLLYEHRYLKQSLYLKHRNKYRWMLKNGKRNQNGWQDEQ